MTVYITDGKSYTADSSEAFFSQYKAGNSHSKGLSVKAYVKKFARILTMQEKYQFKNEHPTADDLVQAWEELGMLTVEENKQHTHTISNNR